MLIARHINSPKHIFNFTRRMSRFVPKSSFGPSSDVEEFGDVLMGSRRILALCGAGLSAASGLDTFRGAGGMWRNHQATSLATPEAFERDPGLVVSGLSVYYLLGLQYVLRSLVLKSRKEAKKMLTRDFVVAVLFDEEA
jgi:Sir2 family